MSRNMQYKACTVKHVFVHADTMRAARALTYTHTQIFLSLQTFLALYAKHRVISITQANCVVTGAC